MGRVGDTDPSLHRRIGRWSVAGFPLHGRFYVEAWADHVHCVQRSVPDDGTLDHDAQFDEMCEEFKSMEVPNG